MKMITAIIKPFKLDDVRQAVAQIGGKATVALEIAPTEIFIAQAVDAGYQIEFAQLADLQVLGISNNELTGTIPNELFTTSSEMWNRLSELYIHNNHFSGTLPSWIMSLPNLDTLVLGGNDWSGTLPSGFLAMPSLGKSPFQLHRPLVSVLVPDFGFYGVLLTRLFP